MASIYNIYIYKYQCWGIYFLIDQINTIRVPYRRFPCHPMPNEMTHTRKPKSNSDAFRGPPKVPSRILQGCWNWVILCSQKLKPEATSWRMFGGSLKIKKSKDLKLKTWKHGHWWALWNSRNAIKWKTTTYSTKTPVVIYLQEITWCRQRHTCSWHVGHMPRFQKC